MNIVYHKIRLLLLVSAIFISGCKKDFLDKEPDSDLKIPTTLTEFRALLDNTVVMSETPVLGELSADNYYLLQNFWMTLNLKEKSSYIWDKDIYHGATGIGDWDKPYQQVFYANVVLEQLEKTEKSDAALVEWNDIKGAALFIRAYAFHNVIQVFSPVYSPNNLDSLGIPLRLTADINVISTRATLKQSYDQIIKDLEQAIPLLKNDIQTQFTNRPSKAAAYALLARVYLSMSDYPKALQYANNSLSLYSYLHDYNNNSLSNNAEVLYKTNLLSSTSVIRAMVVSSCVVDSVLYSSYNINDKRRTLFFTNGLNGPIFRIGYSGGIFMFSGLATDEVYLIKSECLVREGNFAEGINALNTLLQKRFPDTAFVPEAASSQQEALDKILLERRKELVFRGLRWTDIRRLNKDGANIVLRRKIGTQEYVLPPNHPNYVLPLPPDVSQAPNFRVQL